MIVYKKEDLHKKEIPFYLNIHCMYQTISMEVREHMERVGQSASDFTKYLVRNGLNQEEMSKEFLEHCKEIYTYHDIGRALIPVRVLNKTEGLTDEEISLIREHPKKTRLALNALYQVPFDRKLMRTLMLVGTFHHERYDGKGYPKGLHGNQIPYEAAICALADAYDGMTTWKPYKESLTKDQAIKIIEKQAGKQFHPELSHDFICFLSSMTEDEKLSKVI